MTFQTHRLEAPTMFSGYNEAPMPPESTYSSSSYNYETCPQSPSPKPLDLSIAGRNSPGGPTRSSPHGPTRYSPYCVQSSSQTPYIQRNSAPSSYIHQRNSPPLQMDQKTESPYLYRELYTASNVLNEMPGGSNMLQMSQQYEDGHAMSSMSLPDTSPMHCTQQPPHDTQPNNQPAVPEDQVIIMDLDRPTKSLGSFPGNTGGCSKKQISMPAKSKPFPATAQQTSDSPCPSSRANKRTSRPDSSSDKKAQTSIRPSPTRTSSSSSASNSAAKFKNNKSVNPKRNIKPIPNNSPPAGTRSADSPPSFFQNRPEVISAINEQMKKISQSMDSNDAGCVVNLAIANQKTYVKGVERFERDGVPKIRTSIKYLMEKQVEQFILENELLKKCTQICI